MGLLRKFNMQSKVTKLLVFILINEMRLYTEFALIHS